MITNNETCINEKVTGWFESCGDIYIYTDKGDEYDINNSFKLLLRPMSDLYRERNGKIDIVELAKIEICGYPRSSHSPQFRYEIHTNEWGQTYLKYTPYLLEGAFEFLYLKEESSFKKYQCKDNVCQEVGHQAKLFEYLFANHYDIYDLHSKGLCVYYNKL